MNQTNNISEGKVILVGNCGVGKTCLINRFLGGNYKNEQTTIGGALDSLKIMDYNEQKLILHFWDTAGSEKYRSIAHIYYQDAQVAVLVYDVTNRQSFQDLEKWIQDLRDHGPDTLEFILIGNKCDLEDQYNVSVQEAKDFAEKNVFSLHFTSCKDNTGIQVTFKNINHQIKDTIQKVADTTLYALQMRSYTAKSAVPPTKFRIQSNENQSSIEQNKNDKSGCC